MADTETLCQSIYSETREFYRTEIHPFFPDVGFQILYGPPFDEAPILFVGYQPGKGSKTPEEERAYGSECHWPQTCEYATESWPLARWIQTMFGKDLLKKCVGLNSIFIRSNTIGDYRRCFRPKLRQIENFCLPRVKAIVKSIRPRLIVAIGFETLALFGDVEKALSSERNDRVIAKVGQVAGREAFGTLHLSGARISKDDRAQITKFLLQKIGQGHS